MISRSPRRFVSVVTICVAVALLASSITMAPTAVADPFALPETPEREVPDRPSHSIGLPDDVGPVDAETVDSETPAPEFERPDAALGDDGSDPAITVDTIDEPEADAQAPAPAAGVAAIPAQPDTADRRTDDADLVDAVQSGRYNELRPAPGEDPVEIEELRTEESRTYIDSDGLFVTDLGNGPMHVRDDNGRWQPIDTDLVRGTNGRRVAAATPTGVEIGSADNALAIVTSRSGNSVRITMPAAVRRTPAFAGGTASFDSIVAGVDIEMQVFPSGVKETIVLAGPNSPRSFRFELDLDGLTANLTDHGDVELRNSAGDVELVIPKGYMWDSGADPETGGISDSMGVHYSLETVRGRTFLTVALDSAWLDDPARVWPVMVDPTVSDLSAQADDTHVNSCYNANYSTLGYFKVGGAPCQRAGYARWNLDLMPGAKIFGANLAVWNGYSYSCSPRNVSVYRVTQPWSGSTMTTWPGASFDTTPVHSASFAFGYNSGCPSAWATFPVTNLVQQWTLNQVPNYGITYRVNATTTSDNATYKEFSTVETYGLHLLQVRWSPYVPAWSLGSNLTQNVYANQDGYLPITLTNNGPDTWVNGGSNPYRVSYHVYKQSDGTLVQWDGARTSLGANMPFLSQRSISARIAALPPGTYTIHWDIVKEGVLWFSQHWDNPSINTGPMAGMTLTVPNLPPTPDAVSPGNGSKPETRTPQFSLTGLTNPDAWPTGAGISAQIQFCPTREATVDCVSSGWMASSGGAVNWTPTTGVGWGDGYWRYQTREDHANGQTADWSPWRAMRMAPPAADNSAMPPAGAPSVHGVDLLSRSFSATQTDASTTDAGFPVSVVRNYNSQLDTVGAFGHGWVSPLDFRLQLAGLPAGIGAILHRGEGRTENYGVPRDPSAATQELVAPHAAGETLTKTATGYTLTNAGGAVYEFDTTGLPISMIVGDGRGYTYTSSGGQLGSLTTTLSGRSLHLTWSGGRVVEVSTDPIAANGNQPYTWTYSYDGNRLVEVCGPNSATECTNYDYTQVGVEWLLESITQPEGNTTITVDYHTSGADAGRVASVETADGGVWSFDATATSAPMTVTITNPASDTVEWEFDADARIARRRNENGDDRFFTYNDGGFLNETVDEAGNILRYTTDPWGNRLSESLYSVDGTTETHESSTYAGYLRYLDPADRRNNARSWSSDARSEGYEDHTYRTRYLYNPDGTLSAVTDPMGTRPYRAEVLSDGPRILWHGDVTGTAVADAAGTGVTGTASGVGSTAGPTPSSTAFDFAGAGTVVVDGDGSPAAHGLLGSAARTVEVWVRADTFNHGGVYEFGDLAVGEEFSLRTNNVDDNWRLQLYGSADLDFTVPGSKGNWTHIAVTYDGEKVVVYANGVEVASKTVTIDTGIDRDITLGRWATHNLDGAIAEFAVFNHALSAERIAAHAAARNDDWSRTRFTHYTDGTEAAPGGGTMPPGLQTHQSDSEGTDGAVTAYHATGAVATVTTPTGAVSSFTYDELGRALTETTVADGHTVVYTRVLDAYRIQSETRTGVANAVTNEVHTPRTTFTYDANGNLIERRDEDLTGSTPDRVTTIAYNDAGRSTSVTGPTGAVTTHTYDDFGRVVTETDPEGTIYKRVYDATGNMVAETIENFVDDPDAPSTPYQKVLEARTFDEIGRLVTATDQYGTTRELTYDSAGRMVAETLLDHDDGSGVLRDLTLATVTYDAAGNVTERQGRPGSAVVEMTYDPSGSIASTVLDPGGTNQVMTYTYDALGRRTHTWVHDGDENLLAGTRDVFDDYGRQIATGVLVSQDPEVWRETTYTYNQRGGLITQTAPDGVVTETTYDAWGRPYRLELPEADVHEHGTAATTAGAVYLTGLDMDGNPVVTVDPNGNESHTTFDLLGRPTAEQSDDYTPPGSTTQLTLTTARTYDHLGRVVSTTDPSGYTTTFTYDSAGRTIRTVGDPIGSLGSPTTDTIYDDANRTVTTVSPRGAVHVTVADDLGQTVSEIQHERIPTVDSFEVTFDYDDAGNLVSVTDPLDGTITFTHNALGQTLTTVDPDGKVSSALYDGLGRHVGTVDPLGRRTESEFNLAGDLVSVSQLSPSDTLLATATFAYDAAGTPLSTTSPAGWQSTVEFDELGRLATRTEPVSATESITTSFGYDVAGNQTLMVNGNGEEFWTTFNDWGLIESQIEPVTADHPGLADRSWTWTYDDSGRLETLRSPGGIEVTQTYNEAGWVTSRTGSGPGVTAASKSFSYDIEGNLTGFSHPGGTQQLAWNDRNLLVGTTGPAGGATFGYDDAGRLTSRTDVNGTTTATYTAAGLLASVTDPLSGTRTFDYDDAGQITTITYPNGLERELGYDDLGRLVTDTTSSTAGVVHSLAYGYDANGNTTSKEVGPAGVAGAGVNTYTYDRADRLTSWTDPSSTTTSYTWDGAGNRLTAGSATSTFDERNRLISTVDGHLTTELDWSAAGMLTSSAADVAAVDVLLVVDDPTSMTAADTELEGLLDAAGHTVTTRADHDSEAVGPAALVVISPSVGSALGTKYATAEVGVVNFAAGSWDDHGLADASTTASDDEVDVDAPFHYAAAGLDGTVTVASSSTPVAVAAPADLAGGATTVVSETGGDDAVVFAVDDGGTLTNGLAPARRIAVGFAAPEDLDAEGAALVDAAVAWALGASLDEFGFDAFERMVSANGVAFTYDAHDRIATRDQMAHAYAGLELEPVAVGGASFARFDSSLLAQDLGSGATVPLQDVHGDVVAMLDPTTATLSSTTAYAPWGDVTARAGAAAGPLGFQGQFTDPDSELVSMQARWYDPELGVFASRDTLTVPPDTAAAANRHGYANANPMRYSDPTGHYAQCLVPLAGGPPGAAVSAGCLAGAAAVAAAVAWVSSGAKAPAIPQICPPAACLAEGAVRVWNRFRPSPNPRPVAELVTGALRSAQSGAAIGGLLAGAAAIADALWRTQAKARPDGPGGGSEPVSQPCHGWGCLPNVTLPVALGGAAAFVATGPMTKTQLQNIPTSSPPKQQGESGLNNYGANGIDPNSGNNLGKVVGGVAAEATVKVAELVQEEEQPEKDRNYTLTCEDGPRTYTGEEIVEGLIAGAGSMDCLDLAMGWQAQYEILRGTGTARLVGFESLLRLSDGNEIKQILAGMNPGILNTIAEQTENEEAWDAMILGLFQRDARQLRRENPELWNVRLWFNISPTSAKSQTFLRIVASVVSSTGRSGIEVTEDKDMSVGEAMTIAENAALIRGLGVHLGADDVGSRFNGTRHNVAIAMAPDEIKLDQFHLGGDFDSEIQPLVGNYSGPIVIERVRGDQIDQYINAWAGPTIAQSRWFSRELPTEEVGNVARWCAYTAGPCATGTAE